LHARPRAEGRWLAGASVTDGFFEPCALRFVQKLLSAIDEAVGHTSSQSRERMGIGSHGSAFLFFEEREPQLVSYPTNKF
jgi:hypothetical protein